MATLLGRQSLVCWKGPSLPLLRQAVRSSSSWQRQSCAAAIWLRGGGQGRRSNAHSLDAFLRYRIPAPPQLVPCTGPVLTLHKSSQQSARRAKSKTMDPRSGGSSPSLPAADIDFRPWPSQKGMLRPLTLLRNAPSKDVFQNSGQTIRLALPQ